MGWRDGFTTTGDFKGAKFYVRAEEKEVGRRNQVHEYPLRDTPFVESLGRATRRYTIEAYLIGDDYLVDLAKLEEKLEEPGPGTLTHPYYGQVLVEVERPANVKHSTTEGGYARLTLQFVEAGENAFPVTASSTQEAVLLAAVQSNAQAEASFADTFSITDFANAAEDFLIQVDAALLSVAGVIGSVTGPMAAIIRKPAELAAAIAGAVTNISSIATEPLRALNIYRSLFAAGNSISVGSGPRAQQEARNIQALNELVRNAAIIGACNSTANMNLSPDNQAEQPLTRDFVNALRSELLGVLSERQLVIDVVNGAPINDDLYGSLSDLRNEVSIDLSTRGKRLPSIKTIQPQATLPALVLAYREHGDASRDAEIIALNDLRYPGFVPGGRALAVLDG